VTLLEDRVHTLNKRLEGADRRIGELTELLESARQLAGSGDGHREEPSTPSVPESGADTVIDRPVEPSRGDSSVSPPPAESNPVPEKTVSEDLSAGRNARIVALHESGLSPDVIAARTGVAKGEIELIISLRDRRAVR
jgi:hypothetical protein